ncbi:MAG: hypothetical protein QW063_02985 [Candidatus Nanoarchaeia archaeon]
MAPFFKKKKEETLPELPAVPEGEEIPPLPPLPGEEELSEIAPPPLPREPRKLLKPAAPSVMPEPSIPMREIAAPRAEEKATVFVRIDKYKDIMRTVQEMEAKIVELQATLEKISSIKAREAEIIDGWNAMLQDAKSKLDNISTKLTKPEA